MAAMLEKSKNRHMPYLGNGLIATKCGMVTQFDPLDPYNS